MVRYRRSRRALALFLVVLGGIIGIMLIALYLPIFNLGQAMKAGMLNQ